jgi:hypothetical protein
MATAAAVLSGLVNPLNSHQNAQAWLLFALVFLGFLGFKALKRSEPQPTARQLA